MDIEVGESAAQAYVGDRHRAVLVEAEDLGQMRHLQHVLLVHVQCGALGHRADHLDATRGCLPLVHEPERRYAIRGHRSVRVDRA